MEQNPEQDNVGKISHRQNNRIFLRLFNWRILIWIGAFILVYWAFKDVPWNEVWSLLQQLTIVQILILIAINIVTIILFGLRTWILLRVRGQHIPILKLTEYWLAGFAFSFFTPGPQLSGAPLEIYLIQKENDVDSKEATAAVIVSKIIEAMINASFLLIGVVTIFNIGLFPDGASDLVSIFAIGVLSLTVGYLVITWLGYKPASSLMKILPDNWRKINSYDKAIDFMDEAESLIGEFFRTEPLAVFSALIISIIITLLLLGQGWASLYFLGVELSLVELVGVVLAVQVAIFFPTPGGFGAVEAALVFIFARLGFSASQAASFALILRVHDIALGATGLFVGGWKALRQSKKT